MIKIDEQEKMVWLAQKDGWRQFAGHTATVDGIKVSIVIAPSTESFCNLFFSGLDSGIQFICLPLNIREVELCDTKKKTYKMYTEKAKCLQEYIKRYGKETIIRYDKERKAKLVNKFGEIPEVLDFVMEDSK